MKIIFDTPEEKEKFKRKLQDNMCCELCAQFNVPCMCKDCDSDDVCRKYESSDCYTSCNEYFYKKIEGREQETKE